MAKPDCDDGYYKLSYELAAALLTFGFGETEGLILGVVLETQYGFGKRKFVELRPAKLAEEWEVDRSNVHRAIGNLVARNVLLPIGDHRYQFLKDYESWDKKGSPTRAMIWRAYVADSPRRAKSLKPLPAPKERDDLILEGVPGVNDEPDTVLMPVVPKDNVSAEANESPLSPKTTDGCLQRQQTVVSKDNTRGVPPGPPIGEAHAELRREEVKKKSVCVDAGEDEQDPSPELVAFVEAKVVASCKDGIFAADFSPGFAARWLKLAGGDAELVKQAAYAFAEERIGSRAIPSWAESYIRRQAERRARQPKTIPIAAAPRPTPSQSKRDDLNQKLADLARREREGAGA